MAKKLPFESIYICPRRFFVFSKTLCYGGGTPRVTSRASSFFVLYKRPSWQNRTRYGHLCWRHHHSTHTLHAPDIDDDLLSLQTSITAAENWASSWHGRLGHSKTALLPIGQLAETSVRASTPEVEGQPIILVKQHKHQGVVFSNQLDWSAHMMHLLSMGKRKAGFLRFMARELPADLICRLYVSCVRSVLEYASPVWHGGISRQQAIALERIQGSVARRVLKAPWRTPKQVLLERLKWPSLFWRRSVSTTCLLHTLMHNPTSPLNQCLFPFAQSLSSYNLRKPRQLILPRLRTSRHLHSFFYNSARLWNSLPHSLQSTPNHAQSPISSLERTPIQTFLPFVKLIYIPPPPPPALTNVRFLVFLIIGNPCRSGTPTLLGNPQILIITKKIMIKPRRHQWASPGSLHTLQRSKWGFKRGKIFVREACKHHWHPCLWDFWPKRVDSLA